MISSWLYKKSNRLTLVISSVLFMAFMIWVLPAVSATTKEITGSDLSPDTLFFYRPDRLYEIAQIYGEEGRAYYIRTRFTFDIIWPFVYGFFLVTFLSLVFKKLSNHWSKFKSSAFNILPLLAVFFDFLENMSAAYVMSIYPQTSFLAYVSPCFTMVKWLLIYGSFILLFIGLIWLFLSFVLKKLS